MRAKSVRASWSMFSALVLLIHKMISDDITSCYIKQDLFKVRSSEVVKGAPTCDSTFSHNKGSFQSHHNLLASFGNISLFPNFQLCPEEVTANPKESLIV